MESFKPSLVGKVISYDGNKKYDKKYALVTRHYEQEVPDSFNPLKDKLEDLEKKVDYEAHVNKKGEIIINEKEQKEEVSGVKMVEVLQVTWFNNLIEEFSPYVLREVVVVES